MLILLVLNTPFYMMQRKIYVMIYSFFIMISPAMLGSLRRDLTDGEAFQYLNNFCQVSLPENINI